MTQSVQWMSWLDLQTLYTFTFELLATVDRVAMDRCEYICSSSSEKRSAGHSDTDYSLIEDVLEEDGEILVPRNMVST